MRREERGTESQTRNWKNRGSCEGEIGRRMETIGRVLFSLSNLCTIFVIETFRGRKCDALVGVFFFSFLHFVLLSKKSKFRYASCSNETILFSRRERKKGEGKKLQNHRVPSRKLDRYRGITSNLGRGKLGKPVRGTFPRAFGDSSTGTRVYITFSRCHVTDKYHLDSLSLSFSFALSFSSRLTMTDGKRIA